MKTKICSKCNRELPATEEYFTTHPTCSFGLSNKCKDCTSEYMKQRRVIKGKEIDKKNLPYARAWKQKNKEKVQQKQKEWYENNKEIILKKSREYYKEHRQELIEKTKKWVEDNPEKRRAYQKQYFLRRNFNLTEEEYNNLLNKQNNKCSICGVDLFLDKTKAVIDHDHTTGELRGILCTNCNIGLGHFKDNCANLLHAVDYLMGGELNVSF